MPNARIAQVGTALAAWSQYALHSSVHNRHTTGNKKQLHDTQASRVMTSCSTLIETRMEQNQALLLSWNVPNGAACTPNYLPNPVLPLGRADVYKPSLHEEQYSLAWRLRTTLLFKPRLRAWCN